MRRFTYESIKEYELLGFLDRYNLSVSKIYEILSKKYKIRSKWKKNKKRGDTPEATGSREVIQMETIDFGGRFMHLLLIDIFSKEADIMLAPELTADFGYRFLVQRLMGEQSLSQSSAAMFNSTVITIAKHGLIARTSSPISRASIEL